MRWWALAAAGAALVVLLVPRKALAYIAGKPTTIEVDTIGQDGFLLRSDAARAFRQMAARGAAAGIPLKVESAFRSNEEQARLYARYKTGTGNLAAEPGYSNHQSGIAVDIAVGGSFGSPTYLWLAQNARDFGFINTGKGFKSQPEPWHWEFLA